MSAYFFPMAACFLLLLFSLFFLSQIWTVRAKQENRNDQVKKLATAFDFRESTGELPVEIARRGESTFSPVYRKTLDHGMAYCFYTASSPQSRGYELNVALLCSEPFNFSFYLWPRSRKMVVDRNENLSTPAQEISRLNDILLDGYVLRISPELGNSAHITNLTDISVRRLATCRALCDADPTFEAHNGVAQLRVPCDDNANECLQCSLLLLEEFMREVRSAGLTAIDQQAAQTTAV